jgi:4-amino-4-deoxychorismate lyase
MNTACWVDGRPEQRLSTLDRGLHYGDGLFETLAVRDGHITMLQRHIERLREGCRRLSIPAPDVELLQVEVQTAAKNCTRAVLKLIVTRGNGGRGYRPPAAPEPMRILLRYPWPEYLDSWRQQGVHLRVCATRLGRNSRLAGLKHLNRLEQVLARMEWQDSDRIQEGLMLDEEGLVIEGTMTNVFVSRTPGTLATPDLQHCGVAGLMRAYILEQAEAAGLDVRVGRLTLAELLDAREIFLCNSLIGVWPVSAIDDRIYEIGPLTRRAQQWTDAAMTGACG